MAVQLVSVTAFLQGFLAQEGQCVHRTMWEVMLTILQYCCKPGTVCAEDNRKYTADIHKISTELQSPEVSLKQE